MKRRPTTLAAPSAPGITAWVAVFAVPDSGDVFSSAHCAAAWAFDSEDCFDEVELESEGDVDSSPQPMKASVVSVIANKKNVDRIGL